jgi:hypothetical protein
VAAGATAGILAVHDGVEPLTAARSAYRGGRPGRTSRKQDRAPGGQPGGVISGAVDSTDH